MSDSQVDKKRAVQDEILTANSVYSTVHGAHRIAVDLFGITNRMELLALSGQ